MLELAFAHGAEGAGQAVGLIIIIVVAISIVGSGKKKRTPPSTVAAGWYPNPKGRARLRYWDGVRWTKHTAD